MKRVPLHVLLLSSGAMEAPPRRVNSLTTSRLSRIRRALRVWWTNRRFKL